MTSDADSAVSVGTARTDDIPKALDGNNRRPRYRGRFPAVPLALTFAAGILIDRYQQVPLRLLVSLAVMTALVLLVGMAKRWLRISVLSLLLLFGITGAFHHHQCWFAKAPYDVEHLLSSGKTLLRVRGRVEGFPNVLLRATESDGFRRPLPPMTRLVLKISDVRVRDEWKPAEGRLRVDVPGEWQAVPGDTCEATGFAAKFPEPRNPGETEWRHFLWSQGVRGSLKVKLAEHFHIDDTQRPWIGQVRSWLRQRFDQSLRTHLKGDSLAIALAFLLGDRSLLSDSVRNAFIDTGTMHVLAISGVHVTILAWFVTFVCRCLRLSDRRSALVVLLISTAYLAIADVRPPMTRAYVVIVVFVLAVMFRRLALSFNTLAVAALVILMCNPSDLFDVGTQLSFLAVGTIMWWMEFGPNEEINAPAEAVLLTVWQRRRLWCWRLIRDMTVLSVFIWIMTAPLSAATFHVVSPIGPLLNLPLAPIATPALCIGFMAACATAIHPWLGAPFAFVFDLLLRAMLWCVELGAMVPGGHWSVSAPPMWWLIAMYAFLLVVLIVAACRRYLAGAIGLIVVWSVVGFLVTTRVDVPTGLRVTFLSVSRGTCVLVETPSGRSLVFDCGNTGTGEIASRALADLLWHRHRGKIDAVVLSHAEAEYFNGMGALLTKFHADRILTSPAFSKSVLRPARDLRSWSEHAAVALEPLGTGDAIELDDEVQIRVLHPLKMPTYESHESASIVLEVRYREHGFLLLGRLGGAALGDLIRQEARRVDVLLLPNHGALTENSPLLARWAKPTNIVVSTGANSTLDAVASRYSDAVLYDTSRQGAIEFLVSPSGEMTVRTYATNQDELSADD